MNAEKRLFLLDAYALIFRAYYAFLSNPMTNSAGMRTSTVFGFTLALEELLRKEDPTHVAVVFDPPGKTFRNELYPDYKANREETPEEIKQSVPVIKQLIEAFRIPILEEPGFEADDVIGTLAKKAAGEGYTVYMMTPDKDFAQLVSEHIFMYKPSRGGNPPEIMGVEEVKKKFLVEHPAQVIDILALWGDTSDNIPGVPGIGEKTSKKLIHEFRSVEGIYEKIDQIKGKQREKLIQSRDQVQISKELATISLDVPVTVKPSELVRKDMDTGLLKELFNELDFNALSTRILGEGTSTRTGRSAQGTLFGSDTGTEEKISGEAERNIENVNHRYELVEDETGVKELAELLSRQDEFCFDTETTGLDPIDAEIVGMAFSWEPHHAWYVAFGTDEGEIRDWMGAFEPVFADPSIGKTGQNLKYDLHVLSNYGIEVRGPLFDTMVAHFLLKPDQKHNLNTLAEQYLDYSMVKIEKLIGEKGRDQASFRSVKKEQAKEYAGEDADITWQISRIFKTLIKEKGLQVLVEEIEMPLVRVVMKMEHHGVRLDVEALKASAESLRKQALEIEKEIHGEAGMEFNIGSPKQLGEVLFERMKIVDQPKKTRTKQYATNEDVLTSLADAHPIVLKVLEYRSLKKLLSTYIDALPQLVKPSTGRIHTSFNQAQVTTGRLSSNHPNLQNIPVREERGREIRRAFIPSEEGHIFLSADYSQIELRLMAHLSEDPQMIEAFSKGEDIHTATAARIFKVSHAEVTKEMRSRAKTANFGIIYGISAFGLSRRMRIPRSEARQLIDGYFETYPRVKAYMDECIRLARETGYVETMYGRRRYLPDIISRNSVVRGNAERNAINSPIQGSAADIIKIAMVRIQEAFDDGKIESAMILQVHDELNFDVKPGELNKVRDMVRTGMEKAARLKVPLIVDMGEGGSWLEAH